MPVKIRLQRHGRRKAPFYHIVVADARAPRDGRFIEKLGTYNPMTNPATIEIDRMRAYEWLTKGAQPTYTARAILRLKGVMYYKHLMRGVSKGALTQEQAEELYNKWIDEKEAKLATRREQEAQKRKERLAAISGKPKKVQTPKPEASKEKSALAPDSEEPKTFAESVEQTTVESFTGEAPAKEETPVAEEPAKEETPATEEPAKEETPTAEEPAKEEAPATEEPAKEETPTAEEPAKEEAPTTEEPAKEETPTAEEPAKEEAPATEPDDLKKIEGIGPKIEEILNAADIRTFTQLAETDAAKVKELLEAAGSNFAVHDPTTWPQQAKMAAEGKWEELKKWQDELDGGKEVAETKEN